jgi:hypothetical protein
MSTIAERPTSKSSARIVRTASGERVMAMYLDAPELAAELDTLRQEVTRDKASAKRFLISVGIMNRSGKTSKNFGG